MATRSKKIPSLIPRRGDPQTIPATPLSLQTDNAPIGLNSSLLPLNAPISVNRGFVSASQRDSSYESSPYLGATNIVKGAISSREYITLTTAGAEGGGQISYYTDSSTYQGIDSSRVLLNPADFPDTKFYLEAIYRAGTSGEAARTFFMDFYDITGGSAVANGTVTGTGQSGTGYGLLPRARGTLDFRPSLPAGDREYMVRYRGTSTSGTLFVDLYTARLIIDF